MLQKEISSEESNKDCPVFLNLQVQANSEGLLPVASNHNITSQYSTSAADRRGYWSAPRAKLIGSFWLARAELAEDSSLLAVSPQGHSSLLSFRGFQFLYSPTSVQGGTLGYQLKVL